MADELTHLQAAFVDQYFICGLNATEAAIQAGYKCKNRNVAAGIGSENLRKPKIRAAIDGKMAASAMSADEVLYRLTEHARGTMADFWDFDNKWPKLNLQKAAEHQKLHLLKKIKVTPMEHGTQLEIELHDVQSALVQLGRAYKLFTDKIEVNDWRTDAILALRSGDLEYDDIAEEFDDAVAEELCIEAGIPVDRTSKTRTG